MIKISGIDGGLLTIGDFDLLDESLSVPVTTLIMIQSGYYPFIQPRRILSASNLRFRGEIFYQTNALEDHLMLPKHLKPSNTYGMYSVRLGKNDADDTAYLLVNFTHGVAVLSDSFYQLCRYCQDFAEFKINGILLDQVKVYAQQNPRLNLSSDLLGDEYSEEKFGQKRMHDFDWGDDYTPSVIAYVDAGEINQIPFGYEHTGSLIGIGNFKTWYVTAFNEIPEKHINNLRHLVIDLSVTQISAQKFLTNTVTTTEYLKILIDQHVSQGLNKIQITSETRTGLPIYIVYNIDTDMIEECYITYSPNVLQDYINSKHLNFVAVNTQQEEKVEDLSKIAKSDRYEHADMSLAKVIANSTASSENEVSSDAPPVDSQPVPNSSDEYHPDVDVVALQKAQHNAIQEQQQINSLNK